MSDTLVTAKNVSKKFCRTLKRSLRYGVQDLASELVGCNNSRSDLRKDEFWALKDTSFELKRGSSLGLIGRNGAGKTTLLRLLNGLIKPDKGSITVRGKMGALIELGAGFSPILTGRENIYARAAVLGMSKREIDLILDDIIDFAGVEEFIDMPVQNYSSGMRVRLGYAVAAHLNPDILLVDEVLAVGDMAFQRKCQQHMQKYIQNGGSFVLVSHNMHLVQSMCDICLLLDQGQIKFKGHTTEAVNLYFETQQSVCEGELASECYAELSDDNPVIIEKVAICSKNGDEIRTGDSVTIALHYRSIKDFESVTWAFSIWTADQWVRITTARARFSDVNYRIIRGKGHFRCSIPHLPLVAGTYAIKAGIIDTSVKFDIARIGWENAPSFFTVKAPITELENRRAADNDLVILDVMWEKC